MTKLAILTPNEQRIFDRPPKFQKIDRPSYFALTSDIRRLGFNKLRSPVNRVGFILQLGYFRASGKFFVAEDFRKRDIQYVCKMLEIDVPVDVSSYSETSRKNHRDTILELSGWVSPNETHESKIISQAQWFIEQQLSPRKVFEALVEYCWNSKLVIPSYSKLSDYITNHFNHYEEQLLDTLRNSITAEQDQALRNLFNPTDDQTPLARPPITTLKAINQSVKPGEIQKNVEAFERVKSYYFGFGELYHRLKLTDQATEYFATWV